MIEKIDLYSLYPWKSYYISILNIHVKIHLSLRRSKFLFGDYGMTSLTDTIKIIKENRIEFIDEASITSLINGILYAYGWDVFNPYEVEPQHFVFEDSVYSGRVDIALKLFGHRKVFVEIKQSTEKLEKHEKQIMDYLRKTVDVHVGVLTNAESWWFYTSSIDKNNEIKIKCEEKVNIYLDNDSKIDEILSNYIIKNKIS